MAKPKSVEELEQIVAKTKAERDNADEKCLEATRLLKSAAAARNARASDYVIASAAHTKAVQALDDARRQKGR